MDHALGSHQPRTNTPPFHTPFFTVYLGVVSITLLLLIRRRQSLAISDTALGFKGVTLPHELFMHLELALGYLAFLHVRIPPVTTTAGRADDDVVACIHMGRRLAAHPDPPNGTRLLVLPHPHILAPLAVAATRHAIRRDDAPLRQDRRLNGNSELDVANAAVATGAQSGTAAPASDGELAEDDGIALLEELRVSDPRVCDPRVHAALAYPVGARSGSAGDGLVVSETLDHLSGRGVLAAVAKRQVVASTLGSGSRMESLEDEIDHAVCGLARRSDGGRRE